MMQNLDKKYVNSKEQLYVTQDADAYTDNVDNLMDDLFGDVESTLHVDYAKQRSLRQKKSQTTSKASSPYASVQASSSDIVAIPKLDTSEKEMSTSKDTVSITKLNLADIALPPISKQDVLWIQPYIMRNPEPISSNLPQTPSELVVPKYNLTDRLLLVFACSSALIAAVMWTINHGIWLGRQSVNVAQVSSKDTGSNKAFGEEVKRMLSEVVDKNRAIATNANSTIGSNMPLMAAPLVGNMQLPTGTNNPFVNGLQQPMYVPVYQPPALSNSGNSPSPLALPPVTSNNSIDVSNSATTARPNAVSPQFTAAPAPSYTLIGVLDLGDRSTAMLDINGSVQSIGLGKAINNTGWILSRVSQQEIILKRGKETKTIFVGQKF